MFGLEIKAIFPKPLENLGRTIRAASYSAQNTVGFAISQEIYDCVESSGYGTWTEMREITKQWRRGTGERTLSFLSIFSKYAISGNKISAGFLPGGKVYSKFLNRYVENQQSGFSIPVSQKMRGHFARKGFPLKAGTKNLTVPARPIIPLAFKAIEPKIASIFEKKWVSSFERNFDASK